MLFFDNKIKVDFNPTNSYNETNTSLYVALKNPFRYRSYYYDTETNLYYLNSRYYDPEIGRFINIDDISIINESKDLLNGLNLFAYCINNPIMFIDKNGYSVLDWLLGIISIGAVIAGTILIATGAGAFLGGVLISAGINSMVTGFTTMASGGTFTAGWIGGAITGLLAGIGAGFAGSIIANIGVNIFEDIALSVLISIGSGFIGSLLGSVTTNFIDGVQNNWENILKNATVLGFFNIFSVYGSNKIGNFINSVSKYFKNTLKAISANFFEYVSNILSILFNANFVVQKH